MRKPIEEYIVFGTTLYNEDGEPCEFLDDMSVTRIEPVRELEADLNKAIEALEFINDECDWEEFSGGDRRIGEVILKTLQQIKESDNE